MKQKTQRRELSALVPASFVFSDYDEYAVVSYICSFVNIGLILLTAFCVEKCQRVEVAY